LIFYFTQLDNKLPADSDPMIWLTLKIDVTYHIFMKQNLKLISFNQKDNERRAGRFQRPELNQNFLS